MSGAGFTVPAAARWRPPPAAVRQLRLLHRAGVRMAEVRAEALTDAQAAHTLEQQLLQALIECLSDAAEEETPTARRHRDLVARFEDLLLAKPFLSIADTCAALRVSDGLLRACCNKHLALGPSKYGRLRRMQQVHRALRSGIDSVSEVAKRHGFQRLGHFAAHYRASYGELPSVTLRRSSGSGVTELTLGRRRMRLS